MFSEETFQNKKENSTPTTLRSHTEDEFGARNLKEKRNFDYTQQQQQQQVNIEMPMRTVNDLQRNILYYGVSKEVVLRLNLNFYF